MRKSTLKLLSSFRSCADTVLLTPTSRFYIFGEGKDGAYSSLVVEGRIRDRHSGYASYALPNPKDDVLIQTTGNSARPEEKIKFFERLFDGAQEVASFDIDLPIVKEVKRYKTTPTHIRFWRKEGGLPFARAFDAIRYFDRNVDFARVKYDLLELSNPSGDAFTVHIEFPVFRLLKDDKFSVTVLDNGILYITGTDTDFVYYIRDQRLGDQWAYDFDDTVTDQTALMFDPRRATAVRRRIRSGN